jgi:hypothetical protein
MTKSFHLLGPKVFVEYKQLVILVKNKKLYWYDIYGYNQPIKRYS